MQRRKLYFVELIAENGKILLLTEASNALLSEAFAMGT